VEGFDENGNGIEHTPDNHKKSKAKAIYYYINDKKQIIEGRVGRWTVDYHYLDYRYLMRWHLIKEEEDKEWLGGLCFYRGRPYDKEYNDFMQFLKRKKFTQVTDEELLTVILDMKKAYANDFKKILDSIKKEQSTKMENKLL
jgi:hypothetical protein